ncbi:hypothetical protein LCGC14_2310490 [marine sediment metagenome]|uniref:Uncharacterized protein n=1 Tax=marine sediment metagenome TaxID=412755 RepID=A0A0F9FFP4_9ZZZZ
MQRISNPTIAGICGKFQRPENQKQGLHLLAEMGVDAQLEADKKDMRELFEEIEKRRGDSNLITPWGLSFDLTWEEWQKLKEAYL